MLTQAPSPSSADRDRFRALCAEVEEYEHLPELTPGSQTSRPLSDQGHAETLAEAILAGLTQP